LKSLFLTSLENLEIEARKGPMSLGEVISALGSKSDEVLIIFMCLPFLQPIPLPGLSTPLGIVICIGAIFNYLNRPLWLPEKFKKKILEPRLLVSILSTAHRVWGYVEKILKPRWMFMITHPFFKVINVIILCSQALLLCLPLPIPFTNTLPVLVIIANSIGQLEDDGFLVLVSYLIFVGSLSFFSGIALGVGSGWKFFGAI
jgi:hypothetical protein